jgi:hypothetical protein
MVCLILILLLPPTALAHGTDPARLIPVSAGPYQLVVSLYDDPPISGDLLHFSVDPAAGSSAAEQWRLSVEAIPRSGTRATRVRGTVRPRDEAATGFTGEVRLTAPGAWNLHLVLQGPVGTGQADVPLRAAAPAAIPLWLGWAVGLVPVWILLVFVVTQATRVWRSGSSR